LAETEVGISLGKKRDFFCTILLRLGLLAGFWSGSAPDFGFAQEAMSVHPLIRQAQLMTEGGLNPAKVSYYIGQNIDRYVDALGRVTPELQKLLYEIEDVYLKNADLPTILEFQSIVARTGGKVHGTLHPPKNRHSFWFLNLDLPAGEALRKALLSEQSDAEIAQQFPFAEFHSKPTLEGEADVVIVGAGLTGANVAFHLLDAIKKGLRVVILDSDLQKAASFLNGGNFEAMPESFLGNYEGLREERVKYLRLTRPSMTEEEIQKMATEQAEWLLRWCASNVNHALKAFETEGIDAFASPHGWVRIAETAEEEAALAAETEKARALGLEFEFWSKERIREELKINAPFGGRVARRRGN
jgi:hypothetical protein